MDRDTEKAGLPPSYSRRDLMKASALAAGAAGALVVCGPATARATGKSRALSLTVAGYKFDRTEALVDGRVKVEGCDIKFQESGIGDINTNLFSGPQTFDVTEIGLHPYMLAVANDGFQA